MSLMVRTKQDSVLSVRERTSYSHSTVNTKVTKLEKNFSTK